MPFTLPRAEAGERFGDLLSSRLLKQQVVGQLSISRLHGAPSEARGAPVLYTVVSADPDFRLHYTLSGSVLSLI